MHFYINSEKLSFIEDLKIYMYDTQCSVNKPAMCTPSTTALSVPCLWALKAKGGKVLDVQNV